MARRRRRSKNAGPIEELEPTPAGLRNTKEQSDAVAMCQEWFVRDRNAKQDIIAEFDELDKLYRGDHWDLIGPNGYVLRSDTQKLTHPNAVENLAFATVEGLVNEFATDMELIDVPMEPEDEESATVMTELKQSIAYKNRVDLERVLFSRHLFLYGTAIKHTYWDPGWKGGRGPNLWVGEIRQITLHPRCFFPDARASDDLNGTARRCHKAVYSTLEHIRERYPEYGPLVQDGIIDNETFGEADEDDIITMEEHENQTLLLETWYMGEPLLTDSKESNQGPGLHVIWWANEDQPVYLAHANYVYYEPGEDAKFPFVPRQRFPREKGGKTSFWGYSDAHFILNPQILRNKTVELIAEVHMHNSLGQTYYEPGAISPAQERVIKVYGQLAGMHLPVNSLAGIRREFGTGAAASLQNEPGRIEKAMETIIGRFDITQGKTPGSVTAFRALDLLAQQAKVRLRDPDRAIRSAIEDEGNLTNNLITKFYTEARAYRLIGKANREKPVKKVFRLQDIQRVYLPNTGEVMPRSQFKPQENMVEGQDYKVYSPELDTVCRTSSAMPSDRLFYLEMGKELLGSQVIDDEDFFYVLEHGKFPPFEQLIEKSRQRKAAAQQQQMMAQQAQMQPPAPPTPQAPAVPQEPALPTPEELVASLPPEQQAQLAALPPDQLDAAIQELLEAAMAATSG